MEHTKCCMKHKKQDKLLIGAAPKYHRLMLNDVGRQYIIGELRKISSWSQSKADPRLINKNSNEGKT